MDPELRRLLQSGFVQDTLFPITGEPEKVRTLSRKEEEILPSGVTGQFIPERDEIQVKGDRPIDKLLRTLTHESGHRLLDSLVKNNQAWTERELGMFSALPSRFDAMQNIENPTDAQRYAGSNQQEHFATAFERALQALRLPASRQDSALNAADEEIPGTEVLAEFLSNLPLFNE